MSVDAMLYIVSVCAIFTTFEGKGGAKLSLHKVVYVRYIQCTSAMYLYYIRNYTKNETLNYKLNFLSCTCTSVRSFFTAATQPHTSTLTHTLPPTPTALCTYTVMHDHINHLSDVHIFLKRAERLSAALGVE